MGKDLRGKFKIRNDWPKNAGRLPFNKEVIKENLENLSLDTCPVCRTKLNPYDQFGSYFKQSEETIRKHCPEDNYVIQLTSHKYVDKTFGTNFWMKIFTNSMTPKLLADSGVLADLEGEHVKVY
ncbi:MAG: hypothetical protein PVJ67_06350 [Candidatus Pacearchaeota archaeon]|jgi:hypothetical protein